MVARKAADLHGGRNQNGGADALASNFLEMMLNGIGRGENPGSLFTDALMANQCLLQPWGAHYEVEWSSVVMDDSDRRA